MHRTWTNGVDNLEWWEVFSTRRFHDKKVPYFKALREQYSCTLTPLADWSFNMPAISSSVFRCIQPSSLNAEE